MITIEGAAARDVAELTRIAHAAKRHWGYPDEWMRLWAAALTVTEATLAEDLVYLARCDGQTAGFYAMSFEDDDAELEHMWVAPAFMGRGIGRALFEHATAKLWARGCRLLRIASDPGAEGFYLSMGARRVGEVVSTPSPRILPLLEYVVLP